MTFRYFERGLILVFFLVSLTVHGATQDSDLPLADADIAFPECGPVSQLPAEHWEDAFVSGNGLLWQGGYPIPVGKPLKVYILAGQSNMQGSAHFKTFKAIGDDPETSSLLTKILDSNGDPVVCDNAWISYLTQMDSRDTVLTGKVKVGYGFDPERIGPEYAFSLWMDKAHDEPILIIKTAWGGKSLAVDFRPPG